MGGGGREEGKQEMHLFNFYLTIFECADQVVLGSVYEKDGKNDVLWFRFRFFNTEVEMTSFRLVVLVWKRNSRRCCFK